jgi:integrase
MAGGAIMKERKGLVDWVEEYVAYRRNLGYRLDVDRRELLRFAKFVSSTGHRGSVTTEIVLRWVQLAQSANYQHRRFEMVRSFAKYLAIYEPKTEIPSREILRLKCHRPEPYIYSEQQVIDLLQACGQLSPPRGLRPWTYRTLFGLIAATGLRVSEALKLNRDDVDLDQGVLTVRQTKFYKSRFVPVHISTREMLRHYAELRDCHHPHPKSNTFFVSEKGSALPISTVHCVFQDLRRRLGWKCRDGKKSPRIHDLRHTFVCRRILRWYEEGINVNQSIPFISVYLGHVRVTDTYWYLTGVPELMAVTARRFEQFAHSRKGENS